jgi:hypothetical protein
MDGDIFDPCPWLRNRLPRSRIMLLTMVSIRYCGICGSLCLSQHGPSGRRLTENFRPGVMDRLGFSYEELSKLNPRLIYASSTGFGQTGPLRTFPAYDTIVQGMSGLMSITGSPEGPPTRVGTSLSDLVGGLFMFGGIASALYAFPIVWPGVRA